MRSSILKPALYAAAALTGGLVAAALAPKHADFRELAEPGGLADELPGGASIYLGMVNPGQAVERIKASESAARLHGRFDLLKLQRLLEHALPLERLGYERMLQLAGSRMGLALYEDEAGQLERVLVSEPTSRARLGVGLYGLSSLTPEAEQQGTTVYGMPGQHGHGGWFLAQTEGRLVLASTLELARRTLDVMAGEARGLAGDEEFVGSGQALDDSNAFGYVWFRRDYVRRKLGWSACVRGLLADVAPEAFASYASFHEGRVVLQPIGKGEGPPEPWPGAAFAELQLSAETLRRLHTLALDDSELSQGWSDGLELMAGASRLRVNCEDLIKRKLTRRRLPVPDLVAVLDVTDLDRLHAFNRHLVLSLVGRVFGRGVEQFDLPDESPQENLRTYSVANLIHPATSVRDGLGYLALERQSLGREEGLPELEASPAADLLLRIRPDALRIRLSDFFVLDGLVLTTVLVETAQVKLELGEDGRFHGGLSLLF